MVMAVPSGRVVADRELAPARVGEGTGTPTAAALPAKLAPVGPGRYTFRLTFGTGTRDKLDYARALLGHRIPSGDLEQVLDRVLDLAIAQLEKGKFAATDRPRPGRKSTNPRSIPAAVRRAVWKRDQGRCTFVADDGHRCEERTRLEYDHLVPVARGGQATVANLTLRCRPHNALAAERAFGAGFMQRQREAARRVTPTATAAPADEDTAGAEQDATAQGVAEEQAQDVFAALRGLGCRGEQARRAVEHCMALPACSLEERMRAALVFIAPKVRVQRAAAAPG
jgi:5-methylcytosine-specific restriction endonuclease McrA